MYFVQVSFIPKRQPAEARARWSELTKFIGSLKSKLNHNEKLRREQVEKFPHKYN